MGYKYHSSGTGTRLRHIGLVGGRLKTKAFENETLKRLIESISFCKIIFTINLTLQNYRILFALQYHAFLLSFSQIIIHQAHSHKSAIWRLILESGGDCHQRSEILQFVLFFFFCKNYLNFRLILEKLMLSKRGIEISSAKA